MKKIFTIITALLLSFAVTAQEKFEEGDLVENITFTTLEGDSVKIEDLRGKVVYLNFFATWCAPCIKEMTMIQEQLQEKLSREDFYFISLGRAHTVEQLVAFKENKGYTFNMGADTTKEIFMKFSNSGIPLNIIIDKKGEVVLKKTGFSEDSFKKLQKRIAREF